MKTSFSKQRLILASVFALLTFSGCYLTDPDPNAATHSSTANSNFYAHCLNNTQSAVFDVVGNTGVPASTSAAASGGSASLSENSNPCLSAWIPVSVQSTLSGQNESVDFYQSGTSTILFSLDFSPYLANPDANSWQTTGTVKSGVLYLNTLTCNLYRAVQTNSGCPAGSTVNLSCPNLGWQICTQG